MATATKTKRTEDRVVTVETEIFTLTLSKAEAETLRFLMRRIGGRHESSRRGYTDNIHDALEGAGVELRHLAHVVAHEWEAVPLQSGVIYFLDEDLEAPVTIGC